MVCILLARVPHFNSQPHKEADEQDVCCEYDRVISTHSLTRRLTLQMVSHEAGSAISTHSLTRRLTRSSTPPLFSAAYFNSQPHKEADPAVSSRTIFLSISTHSLTRRLTTISGIFA